MARDFANRRELSGHRNRGAFDFLTKPIDFLTSKRESPRPIRHIEILREARRRHWKLKKLVTRTPCFLISTLYLPAMLECCVRSFQPQI